MYLPDGLIIRPTSYGRSAGDNYGQNAQHTKAAASSTAVYTYKLDLVRTNISLAPGVFQESLVRFGYQDGNLGVYTGRHIWAVHLEIWQSDN